MSDWMCDFLPYPIYFTSEGAENAATVSINGRNKLARPNLCAWKGLNSSCTCKVSFSSNIYYLIFYTF